MFCSKLIDSTWLLLQCNQSYTRERTTTENSETRFLGSRPRLYFWESKWREKNKTCFLLSVNIEARPRLVFLSFNVETRPRLFFPESPCWDETETHVGKGFKSRTLLQKPWDCSYSLHGRQDFSILRHGSCDCSIPSWTQRLQRALSCSKRNQTVYIFSQIQIIEIWSWFLCHIGKIKVRVACYVSEINLRYAWNMLGICLNYSWDMCDITMIFD